MANDAQEQKPAIPPATEEQEAPPDAARFVAWLSELRADMAESVGGVLLQGARPVPFGGPDGTRRPATSDSTLVGWSLRTSGAVDAVVRLRAGTNADGTLVAIARLGPGEDSQQWLGPGGVSVPHGLFVQVLPATEEPNVEGAVYLRGSD